ncbi:structure-specific endonuclease subunit SLX4 isoform X1 [Syngnathus typhle]|uniref:structure-specific endonuclease subunit SLX4 isoform X1 n=1 Tax=Syngnathus typhle TaxID=161592 RepID=UPI002A6B4631|nr:structure-specific endonuclease subunit SLX4 isoform X1 [Syngnathus typhle]
MNESDQDFVDLCSKLLKRSRKKGSEPKRRRIDQQTSCQTSDGNQRNEGSSGSQLVRTDSQPARIEAQQLMGNTGKVVHNSGDVLLSFAQKTEPGMGTKDKLLNGMQQFKRANQPRMVHNVEHGRDPSPPQSEIPQSSTSEHHLRLQDSDEVLAMRMQKQLDHEAAEVHTLDLAAEGLFFCHICHRNVSHMTPEGRAQHINRCLDDREHQMAAPPRPPPADVPDCPICGKKFKSRKSRSTHLKRCSADMGVSPTDLLQALQRQAEEAQRATSNTLIQTGGGKRKGVMRANPAAKKKPRKKTDPLDEDTIMALTLSSSLLEQERKQLSLARTEIVATDSSMNPVLKWRPDAGKGHGKRKKGTAPRPPPILLIQDADAALTRLQDRVSALLLCSRAPSPPTPTRCPSTLSTLRNAAPLWQKSALLIGHSTSVLDFFVPELKDFLAPWEAARIPGASTQSNDKASILSSSQTTDVSSAPSSQSTGHLPANSQALQELVDLSNDEIARSTYTAPGPSKDKNTSLYTDLQVSGFFLEETTDPCVKGAPEGDLQCQAGRSLCQPEATKECSSHLSVALSTLASNLSSMVNNPLLSDWQLQVDSGQVFFAHSFMIYARCPLLAEMMHESGIGVHEEGMPAAQRLLINDVPGQAVLVLLQYLYTAHFSFSASLHPRVLELASRFDLQELQQLCECHTDEASAQDDAGAAASPGEHSSNGTDEDLTALFNSMWCQEDDADQDESNVHQATDVASGDKELHEEQVNEEELDEIYEFAATQRMRDEEEVSVGESDEGGEGEISSKLSEPGEIPGKCSDKSPQSEFDPLPDHSLDISYNRLFSDSEAVSKEDQNSFSPPSSTPPQAHTPHAPTFKSSSRTTLQSSASLQSDSPTDPSILPPHRNDNCCTVGVKEIVEQEPPEHGMPLKPQSRVPLLSNSPQIKEPDLIVLSDSSEDMEGSVSNPSAQSPILSHSHSKRNFTHLKPTEPSAEQKHSRNMEHSLVDLSESPNQCNPLDCSPELFWIVPPTPVSTSPRRTSLESSTHAKSSMRRAELFPKEFCNTSKTSNIPTCFSTSVFPLEESGAWLNPEKAEVDSPALAEPKFSLFSGVSNHLHDSSKQETPLQPRFEPSSSTPLHLDILQHRIWLDTSPPYTGIDEQKSFSQEHKSPEKIQFDSFRLSPFSDSSQPQSSPTHKRSHNSTGFKLMSGTTSREDGKIAQLDDDVIEEVERNKSFEQASLFMDEPPMAFNDSWGLNDCDDVAGNSRCFSLRLEDSGGRSRPVDAAASSPSPPSCQNGVNRYQEPQNLNSQPSTSKKAQTFQTSTADVMTDIAPEMSDSNLVANMWDSLEEEEEILPLSQRLKLSAQLKTPPPPRNKKRPTQPLVPITPMPHYSDMDTPELKNKLNRFGVRALPKRQMIVKLKEIHQYTHQLVNSDCEDEAPCAGPAARTKPAPSKSLAAGDRPVSLEHKVHFKEPRVATSISAGKHNRDEEDTEPLSNSQDSNVSSTTSSEDSERHNPELCLSSGADSDSDGGVSPSQAATRLQDRLQAVRSFILSDSGLYTQILQYQPLVLSQLKERLKAAGIRLGAAKLVNFLDSQCITFTTAKPGQAAPTRRRVRKPGKKAKAAGK